MHTFKDGVAVVTGAGSGLGRALALAAADRGMRLVLADVQADALERTAQALRGRGTELLTAVIDVADAAAVESLAQRTERHFGAVRLVFNNAGVTAGGPVWQSTEQDWDWVLGVNLKGVIHGVHSFTPRMLAAAAADPTYTGCIVNTASLAGLLTAPGMGVYAVSKHAVVALSECLHHDLQLAGTQVRAAVLCPSYVPTDIGQSDRNRPAHLRNAEPPTPAQLAARAAAQQAVQQGGISAAAVAEITFGTLENGGFYIFPSPELLPVVRSRMEHVLNQTVPELPYALFPALKDRRDRMLAAAAAAAAAAPAP